MSMKRLFIALVLFSLLFSEIAGQCFADIPAQLQQAETYSKNGQYKQAEAIYKKIVTDYAFEAQKNLIVLYIVTNNRKQANAALGQLLANFAEHERLPHTIHEIAEQCNESGKAGKVRELYQHLLANQPNSAQAIWLQMGLTISNILLENDTGAWAEAGKLLVNFSADERCAEAVGQVAWSYRKLKQYENARTLYQHVVNSWPDRPRAIFSQRGIVLTSIALGDDTTAEAATQKLLRQFSQNEHMPEVVSKIGDTYLDLEKYDKARELHRYILDNHPDSEEAILSQRGVILASIGLGDDANTEAGIGKLLVQFSSNKLIAKMVYHVARKLNNKAETYRELGKYEKARELHQYILDNHPDFEDAIWSQRGVILSSIGLGDDADTEAGIEKLLAQFSSNKNIAKAAYQVARKLNNKAETYRDLGKYEKARELHQYILDNHPDFEEAILSQRGVILSSIALGDDAGIEAGTDGLLTKFSSHKDIVKVVYRVAHELNKKKDPKAGELYQYIVSNYPDDELAVLAQAKIGNIKLWAGDDRAARTIFDQVLTDFAGHPILPKAVLLMADGYWGRALLERRQGRDEQAKDYFEKAIAEAENVITHFPEIPHTTAGAHHLTAECYRVLGSLEKAIEYYQKLADYQPDYPYASLAPSMVRLIKKYIKNMEEIARSGAEPPPPSPRWLDKNVSSNEGGQK